jgi:hypothetical protein
LPVNTTYKVEVYKIYHSPTGGGKERSRDREAIFADSGAPYLCTGKIDHGSLPKYGKWQIEN